MTNKAVFWDRDGTLNILVDGEPPRHASDISVFPNAIELMKKYNEDGYMNFVITNQPDYALGKVSCIDDILYINEKILDHFEGLVDDYRICFHHPNSRFDDLRECNCRKPKTGMIDSIVEEHDIDLASSILIGDRDVDIQAGRNAGIGLVIRIDRNMEDEEADVTVANLKEILRIW